MSKDKKKKRDSIEKPLKRYAKIGWSILPLHYPIHRGKKTKCSCKKADCSSVGKHPLTKNGLKDASTDGKQIQQWAEEYPDANIGVKTGKESGIIVVDIDVKHNGFESLDELQEEFGQIPDTIEQETGGGGKHMLFKYPDGVGRIRNKAGLRPGIDIRADGGYIVVEPSIHQSGSQYNFDISNYPGEVEPAEPPGWLVDLIVDKSPDSSSSPSLTNGSFLEGTRNQELCSLAGSMRAKGMSIDAVRAALLEENKTKCIPPLSDKEVTDIANSIGKYAPKPKKITTLDIGETSLPPKLDDVDPAVYHGLAGEIVKEIIPHSEGHPMALLMTLIVMVGNMMGRNPHITREADNHFCNFYCCLVGDTAKARKGTSYGQVLRFLKGVDKKYINTNVKSGLSSGEGLIFNVRDPVEGTEDGETVVKDKGVEDKRLMVYESEFASVLKHTSNLSNILTGVMRDAWDRGTLRTMTKNNPCVATDAHISILSHITTQELRHYLTKTEAGNGFGNRFIWIYVSRSKLLPFGGELKPKQLKPYQKQLKEVLEFAMEVGLLALDDKARARWADEYGDLSEGYPGLLGAVTSRAEPQVLRLASIYAVFDQTQTISTTHLEAALAIWKYSLKSCMYIFGNSIGNDIMDRIEAALQNEEEGLTTSQIHGLFANHKSKSQIYSALSLLMQTGKIYKEVEPTDGRSVNRYFIIA